LKNLAFDTSRVSGGTVRIVRFLSVSLSRSSHFEFLKESFMAAKKQGFTLVELLVVIAIIGVLVSLLLPAVQAAREAARRMQCSNNLKQISLAVHNYNDTHNAFPVGAYSCCWGTWLVALLPYIEQQPMFDNYSYFGSVQNQAGNNYAQTDGSTRYGGVPNRPVTQRQLAAYSCPSDTTTAAPNVYSGITFHNYVGNYGNTTLGRRLVHGVDTMGNENRYHGAPFVFVGAWNSNPQVVRFRDVMDGLSNTLLFSETVQGRDGDLRGFAWWNGGSHFSTFLTPNTPQPDVLENIAYCRPANRMNPPCTGPTAENPSSIAARSRHPGGVMGSFCDGSVRFFPNTVHIDTWRWLGSAYGNETINMNF
jgi:prepilin-type N-terminal cleavage/methylation domain-containing protein/prepilin-type processing-associated H-X9-DG protein